jgi:hypothetical protein
VNENTVGRTAFLVVAVTTVLLAGLVGGFVGANAIDSGSQVVLFGGLTIPVTPVAMAGFGVLLATALVGSLLVAVSVAARFDPDAVSRSR